MAKAIIFIMLFLSIPVLGYLVLLIIENQQTIVLLKW
jgi:hypothetical protein